MFKVYGMGRKTKRDAFVVFTLFHCSLRHIPDAPFLWLRDLFNRLDVDGSGGISLEELSQGLAEQGYTVTPHEVEQLMGRLDLDADGNIQMDEFAASMIDWKDVRTPLHLAATDCVIA